MRFSVVIHTFNRRDLLARTLAMVCAQQFPRDDHEVVVVSDGCTDGTAEFVRTLRPPCRIRVLELPNQGPGMAYIAGIEAAEGELVLSLDDDILVGPDLLTQHDQAHSAGEPLVAFGPVLVSPESPRGLAAEYVRRSFDAYYRAFQPGDGGTTTAIPGFDPNSSVRRSVFLKHVKADKRFSYCGDRAEVGMQLARAKVPFRFLPDAVTYQVYVKTVVQLARDHARHGEIVVRLCRKYPEWRERSPFCLPFGPIAGFMRKAAATGFFPPDALLAAMCRWSGGGTGQSSRTALRLLRMRLALQTYRGAIREAGSWNELMRLCGPVAGPVMQSSAPAPQTARAGGKP
ncbi:MAG: glycosyltransferase family 2 protein [Terriglobales bacterium]